MIKSLKDACIADGVPRILREQPWVKALSLAVWELHKQTMAYIDGSQIYTAIDTVREAVLDALAVNWKIDWYDTGYDIEQKRRIVKTALTIRRTMGTAAAAKAQADAIYPGSTLEEWFNYGGRPGMFRMAVDVSTTGPGNTIDIFGTAEIERRLTMAKRYSSHMESMSYQIKHGIKINSAVSAWTIRPPLCGTIRCGTYHTISTLGWSDGQKIAVDAMLGAYLATPELCGTLPEHSKIGYSVHGTIHCTGAKSEAFIAEPEESGTENTGTVPQTAVVGQSVDAELHAGNKTTVKVYAGVPSQSGVAHCGTMP